MGEIVVWTIARRYCRDVSHHTVADFLLPPGYERPARSAVLRERAVVTELSRYARQAIGDLDPRRRAPYAARGVARHETPVLLVPGFLAGDFTLAPMARTLRQAGFRTYRSQINANVGCTLAAAAHVETRLEHVAERRGTRVQLVGHSLGGMIARGIAARRPDLVSGIVTLGSPMMAPAAHHGSLSVGVDVLVRLSRVGVPGLMAEDCVAGECARESFSQARAELAADQSFTAFYSYNDGFVDPHACIDPVAVSHEVTASHVGMALDPSVIARVLEALSDPAAALVGRTAVPTSVPQVRPASVAI